MALTYSQLVSASEDTTFRGRVKAAMIAAAIAITVDSPTVGLETRRDRFGRAILANPEGWGIRFSLPVALGFGAKSNTTLTDATDAEIDTRVAGVYNDLMDQ